jgi:hypothetical protein
MVQLLTCVPQSMRQLAFPRQLSVQLLLRLPPHCSQQVAPVEQLSVPSLASSARAVQVEPPAQPKAHVSVFVQLKVQLQPLEQVFEQEFPPEHES